ncbi:hypothetical protein H0H93_007475 [Arthromyces matolae]|nr:hypothetical protein H0H93_007475 [Arthromyces matolae]
MLPHRARAFHSSAGIAREALRRGANHQNDKKIFQYSLKQEKDTAYIKLANQNVLRSPADAFALLHDVERRFGPIQEYVFQRDADQRTRYQTILNVVFKNPASYESLPLEATVFQLERPPVISDVSGGIGLGTLLPFLSTEKRVSEDGTQPASTTPPGSDTLPRFGNEQDIPVTNDVTKVLKYSIQRSGKSRSNNYRSLSAFFKTATDVPTRTARSFVSWGGFAPLKPISAETRLRISDIFEPSSVDKLPMRCALRRYSEMSNVDNPWETTPENEARKTQLADSDPFADSIEQVVDTSASRRSSHTLPPESSPSSSRPSLEEGNAASSSTSEESVLSPPTSPTSSWDELVAASVSADFPPANDKEGKPSASASVSDTTLRTSIPKDFTEDQTPAAEMQAQVTPTPSPETDARWTSVPKTIAEAEALVAKMHLQAKTIERKKTKEQRHKKLRETDTYPNLSNKNKTRSAAPPPSKQSKGQQTQTKPRESDAGKGAELQKETDSRKAAETRKEADSRKADPEQSKTIGQRVSGFFSNLF